MIYVKCISKLRENNGRISKYLLEDMAGNREYVNPDDLKYSMVTKHVDVLNLALTSDNRIIDKSIEYLKKDKSSNNIGEQEKIGAFNEVEKAKNVCDYIASEIFSTLHGVLVMQSLKGIDTNVKVVKYIDNVTENTVTRVYSNEIPFFGVSGNIIIRCMRNMSKIEVKLGIPVNYIIETLKPSTITDWFVSAPFVGNEISTNKNGGSVKKKDIEIFIDKILFRYKTTIHERMNIFACCERIDEIFSKIDTIMRVNEEWISTVNKPVVKSIERKSKENKYDTVDYDIVLENKINGDRLYSIALKFIMSDDCNFNKVEIILGYKENDTWKIAEISDSDNNAMVRLIKEKTNGDKQNGN